MDSNVTQLVGTLSRVSPGRDGWSTALCPFHEDTHPSFSFNIALDRWRCFAGCGGGKLSLAARYGPRR
jgi:DNA primase